MSTPLQSGTLESEAFSALVGAVRAALETYSNVHRGSGYHSQLSTRLFEQAREIVLHSLGLGPDQHLVVFCTPRRAEALRSTLGPGVVACLSSADLGLPLGVRALVLDRRKVPPGAPSETGGGTARLVAPSWVVWARAPDRLEAGTPAIINVIAFARALQLVGPRSAAPRWTAPLQPGATPPTPRQDELLALRGQPLLDRLRQSLIGRGATVPTVDGLRPYVNLDNAASTPTFEPIFRAAVEAWRQPPEVQEALVLEARSICAEVLGAPLTGHDVIFTSNTTEAINLAAEGLRREPAEGHPPVVVNTLLEHNSNELPWRMIPGCSLVRMPVDAEGFLDLDQLDALLAAYNQQGLHGTQRVKLVAVSGASNVLGVCNDLAAISRIAHRHGARVLVDAAQLVAHRPIAMEAWGIDYLAFSAHKAYAPFGSGALVVKKGLLAFGASELETIRASGEENVGGIAALGTALRLLQRIGFDLLQQEEQALTALALRGLAQVPGLTLHGTADPGSTRFAHRGPVLSFSLKAAQPAAVAQALAERGIGVRSGCHCAHLLIKRLLGISPSLERFQRPLVTLFPRLELPGVVRASLGLQNGEQDVEALLLALGALARGSAPGRAERASLHRRLEAALAAASQRVFPTAGVPAGALPTPRAA